MHRRGFFVFVVSPLASRWLLAFPPQNEREHQEYSGTLEDTLVPEFSFFWTTELSSSASVRANFAVPVPKNANVFDGELRNLTGKDPIPVVLVESPNQGAYLYADLDHDGRFGSSEEVRFQPVLERPKAIGDFSAPR